MIAIVLTQSGFQHNKADADLISTLSSPVFVVQGTLFNRRLTAEQKCESREEE